MNVTLLAEFFEAVTIFCFGLSWPISIRKSFVSKTSKGKSLFFEIFIIIGYAFGIARKFIQDVFLDATGFIFYLGYFFYVLNFIMIAIDIVLYFRNSKLDKLRDAGHEV